MIDANAQTPTLGKLLDSLAVFHFNRERLFDQHMAAELQGLASDARMGMRQRKNVHHIRACVAQRTQRLEGAQRMLCGQRGSFLTRDIEDADDFHVRQSSQRRHVIVADIPRPDEARLISHRFAHWFCFTLMT